MPTQQWQYDRLFNGHVCLKIYKLENFEDKRHL